MGEENVAITPKPFRQSTRSL